MNAKTTNLTEWADDSWGNAWVEVTIGRDDRFIVSIIGYCGEDGTTGTDEAWNTRVNTDECLPQIVRAAKAEADRLDGDFA